MAMSAKVVVVTGAGSGIGRAVAAHLAGRGALVAALGRRPEPLAAVRDEAADPASVLPLPCDVGEPDATAAAVDQVVARFGHVDAVVNNAGLARFAPLAEARPEDLDAMLAVNLKGLVHVVRACLPQLRSRHGAIVNVTSVGGALPMPMRSLYGATKAAANSLTRSWARELAPDVRVNAVLPGPVDTPMYDDLGLSAAGTEQLRADLVGATLLGRFGTPLEIARCVEFLLDDETGAWITGALIPVDGGRTC